MIRLDLQQLLRYVNRYQAVESDNNSGKMSDPEKQKFFRKQVDGEWTATKCTGVTI